MSLAAEASILNTPKSLVTLSSSKLSDNPITIPIFVSHVPTGLTSPKALRSKLKGFGKGNKDKRTYPSFLVDSHREPTVNTTFSKDKCNRTQKKQTGNMNRRSSPQLDMYSSSIAERTRSHASKNSHGTLPKVTKKAKRQLSKLEITMNAFKSYQTHVKIQNDDGLQNHDSSEKRILSGNRVKKDSGKRKRSRKQPRSDLKKKRYNTSNYQQPSKAAYAILDEPFDQPTQFAADRASKNCDEIKQSGEVANNRNGGKLDKNEGEMDKSDKSDGELDSSYENESGDDLEGDKNRVFDETKGENNHTAVEKNVEGKSEGKHKEDRNVDKLVETQENKNEHENMDEEVLELDKIEGKEDGTDKHKRQASNKEVGEVEIKQKRLDLKESQCAVEEKLQKEDTSELEEERSGVENIELEEERSEVEKIEENLEEKSVRKLEDNRKVENKENLEKGKNGGELEGRSEVENRVKKLEEISERELEEDSRKVENKEENLEKGKNGGELEGRSEVENIELEEERNEVENIEENLEEQSERVLEENSKIENKEDNLIRGNNVGGLEGRSKVRGKLHVTNENEGELRDNMEDENKEELKANKNEVETKEKLQEDKIEVVLNDNRNGVEKKLEDKDKENKSDGELDSEEDESFNHTPEPMIYASPGMKQGSFLKVSIVFNPLNYLRYLYL